MERTWKPTAAGILCIIGGIGGVFFGIVAVVFLFFVIVGGGYPISLRHNHQRNYQDC